MNDEINENQLYKKVIQKKFHDNEQSFCPFRREKQMDYLFGSLQKDFELKDQKILDLCCGYGRLLYFLEEFDPEQSYYGIDYLEELLEKGKTFFEGKPNISFELGNAYNISAKYKNHFDISILHKTLSWMPYYEKVVEELIQVTNKKIYITSLFWDGDIDFIVKVFEQPGNKDSNFTYLNTYSLPLFELYCLNMGAKKVIATPMHIDVDLPRPQKDANELATYTEMTMDSRRLELTGPILLSWKLIEIVL